MKSIDGADLEAGVADELEDVLVEDAAPVVGVDERARVDGLVDEVPRALAVLDEDELAVLLADSLHLLQDLDRVVVRAQAEGVDDCVEGLLREEEAVSVHLEDREAAIPGLGLGFWDVELLL